MAFHSETLVRELSRRAQRLRILALQMIYEAQSGHPGGSLSAAEIVAALYFHQLRLNPQQPDWPDRDRFILSKGHSAPVYYAALAEAGILPAETLKSFRKLHCVLQGHPDRTKTPGVDMSSGPLGNGLSVGVGLALSGRLRGAPYRTYVLLGDGELDAGLIWEAAMLANKYKVGTLTAIVDYNGVQLAGAVQDVMPLEPLADKWRAFGWRPFEIDGHNMRAILEALDACAGIHGQPTVIIAHTIKGKGVSFMEGRYTWHSGPPNAEQFQQAMRELQEGMPQ